jgi:hypothetical protein
MVSKKKTKSGLIQNIKTMYLFTYARTKAIPFIMAGIFLLVVLLTTLTIFLTKVWIFLFLGIILAVFAPIITMGQIGNKKGMDEIIGKPGASAAILSSVKTKNWTFEEQPIAVSQKTMDLIFRGVGKPGIMLVSEGSSSRVGKMLKKERLKLSRIAPNVKIHTVQSGNERGQVPIKKLAKEIRSYKSLLKTTEVEQLKKRMQAIGAFRPPIPKGIDPMNKGMAKGSRKALRGK